MRKLNDIDRGLALNAEGMDEVAFQLMMHRLKKVQKMADRWEPYIDAVDYLGSGTVRGEWEGRFILGVFGAGVVSGLSVGLGLGAEAGVSVVSGFGGMLLSVPGMAIASNVLGRNAVWRFNRTLTSQHRALEDGSVLNELSLRQLSELDEVMGSLMVSKLFGISRPDYSENNKLMKVFKLFDDFKRSAERRIQYLRGIKKLHLLE